MSALAGWAPMVRLVLRRDRIRLPVWIVAVVALVLSSVASVTALYASQPDREAYAAAVGGNPAAIMMGGPGAGLPSLGGIAVFEMAVPAYVVVGLMNVLLVVRHTRAEEDAGRTELLRAGVVGRLSGPLAALAVLVAANVVLGAAAFAGMVALGLPLRGSLAMAGSMVGFGVVMATVAALAAQVTESPRAAGGLGVAVLALFFVLRAAGDVGNGALSWLSPMGWALATRPFGGERWWVLVLPVLLAAVLVALTLALVERRDVGAGLVPPRPGRPTASRWLAGPTGLAVRQQRASVLGWGVGMLLLGAAYGSVDDAVEDLVSQNEALEQWVAISGTSLTDSFFAVSAAMIALMVGGFALQASARLGGEESGGRLESLVASPVPRWRWAVGHLLVAAVGATVLLAAAGLGLGASHAALSGDGGQVGRLLVATLVHAPAVWTLVGATGLLFGLVPRAVPAVWLLLVVSVVVMLLSEVLQLPDWTSRLSPYTFTPQVPAETLSSAPLLGLSAVAVGLAVAGLAAFRRRDIG